MLSDQVLHADCQPVDGASSDASRLAAVISGYTPALYNIALRKLGNVHDAEDALQEAFLSAFKNIHQFRGQAQLSTWLGAIVINSARVQLRRRSTRILSIEEPHEGEKRGWVDGVPSAGPDPEQRLGRTETRECLRRVAVELPTRLRAVFRLLVFDGLSISEAAAALGISEGTVKCRFFRARMEVIRRMRNKLKLPGTSWQIDDFPSR